jgi:hypothetical protein
MRGKSLSLYGTMELRIFVSFRFKGKTASSGRTQTDIKPQVFAFTARNQTIEPQNLAISALSKGKPSLGLSVQALSYYLAWN